MYIFHEIHCDDFVLSARRDRASYEAAVALVDRLCRLAEARGLRVALGIRHPLAEAAAAFEGADNAVARWAERGHAIAAHAHMRHIRRTAEAIAALGVSAPGVVPGFIQSTRAECARRLRACAHLGFRWATDQVQDRVFPYGGLTPWRPAPDFSGPGEGPLVFIEPSVNPFDWGLLEHTGDPAAPVRQRHGLRAAHFERLLALLDRHLDGPRPHPICTFGYVFHEHQHTRGPDSLVPDEASLVAWDDFLAAAATRPLTPCLPEDIYRAWTALEGEVREAPPGAPARLVRALDRRDLRHDLRGALADRLPAAAGPRRAAAAALAPLAAARSRLAAARRRLPSLVLERLEGGEPRTIRVGDRRIAAVRTAPPEPAAAIVVSVSGTFGGRADGTRLLGFTPGELAARGWAVWVFDRTGTGATRGRAGLSPGRPLHADDAAAVWAAAAAEGLPTGWLTWSAGVLPALLSLDRCRPAFLVDAEAPADRLSLRPPRRPDRLLGALELEREHLALPDIPEPYRLLPRLRAPYHRLQAERDHQHGRCALHARVMLDAAPPGSLLNGAPWDGRLRLLPGRLADSGSEILAMLDELLASLRGAPPPAPSGPRAPAGSAALLL